MKRLWLALALAVLCLPVIGVAAQTLPSPQGYVSDFAGLLTPDVRQQLEGRLVRLEKDTRADLAVATVTSLEGTSIEDYASRLFEKWAIGKKDQDNGVLFIIAPVERQVRIEVGYGLEPVITDGRAGRILDTEVVSHFKEGDYQAGIIGGVSALESYIRAGTPPAPLEDNPVRDLFGQGTTIFVVLGIVTIYLMGFMARSKSIWLGGIWGAVVGVVLGLMAGGILAVIMVSLASTLLGLLLDFVLSRNYKERAASGQPVTWFPSAGGFRGSSGGSFGGFGGGSSGGGGASRGW